MLMTPLEQFQILSIFSVKLSCFDFSFTNMFLMSIIVIFFYYFILINISSDDGSLFLVPNNWQILFETVVNTISQLLFDNLNKSGEIYFPFVFVIFVFILILNLGGLIPYSFTVTSHLIITCTLSFSIFIGVNIICANIYKFEMLSLFIPSNTSFFLALLLVPIEFISYIFKPISLGVRLFANLMAGHTLLKVIVGFSWSMLFADGIISFCHIFLF